MNSMKPKHIKYPFQKLKNSSKKKYPKLKIETILISLNKKIEKILNKFKGFIDLFHILSWKITHTNIYIYRELNMKKWNLNSWTKLPAKHLPVYQDKGELDLVLSKIKKYPPLVFAGESRSLKRL